MKAKAKGGTKGKARVNMPSENAICNALAEYVQGDKVLLRRGVFAELSHYSRGTECKVLNCRLIEDVQRYIGKRSVEYFARHYRSRDVLLYFLEELETGDRFICPAYKLELYEYADTEVHGDSEGTYRSLSATDSKACDNAVWRYYASIHRTADILVSCAAVLVFLVFVLILAIPAILTLF